MLLLFYIYVPLPPHITILHIVCKTPPAPSTPTYPNVATTRWKTPDKVRQCNRSLLSSLSQPVLFCFVFPPIFVPLSQHLVLAGPIFLCIFWSITLKIFFFLKFSLYSPLQFHLVFVFSCLLSPGSNAVLSHWRLHVISRLMLSTSLVIVCIIQMYCSFRKHCLLLAYNICVL